MPESKLFAAEEYCNGEDVGEDVGRDVVHKAVNKVKERFSSKYERQTYILLNIIKYYYKSFVLFPATRETSLKGPYPTTRFYYPFSSSNHPFN